MNLEDKLEIFIITYNRKDNLAETFNQIFDYNSPIKDFPITILDNKSNDGTAELIEEYKQKFPKIKHIINNRNIGGNANAVRAYELASKEYVWVLCDDDAYNFSYWDEVVREIEAGTDAIIVTEHKNPKANIVQKICGMSFVPGTIWKTENITSTVISNAYYLVYTYFPQMALALELVNKNKKIVITEHSVVKPRPVPIDTTQTYTRGLESGSKSPNMTNTIWAVGMCNALDLLKDKKLKAEIIDHYTFKGKHELRPSYLVKFNRTNGNNSLKNLCDAFCAYSTKNKLKLIYYICKVNADLLLSFYKNDKGLYVRLFNRAKIKLIPFFRKRGKNSQVTIPVCFVTDENYVKYMGVTIESILNNAAKGDKYNFYILSTGLSQNSKDKLMQTVKTQAVIDFIEVGGGLINAFQNLKQRATYISKSSYFKFAIAELIPQVDKIIYLDSDLIVTGTLRELYQKDISDYLIGAVEDIGYTYWSKTREDLKLKFKCINSGVMLINSKKWREEHLLDSLMDCAADPEKTGKGQDQPVINYVCKDKVLFLDFKYNVQDSFFRNEVEVNDRYDLTAVEKAVKKPLIIHYTTAHKPWKFPFMHNGSEFWTYYIKSPFMTKELRKRFHKTKIKKIRYSILAKFYIKQCKYQKKLKELVNQNIEEIT